MKTQVDVKCLGDTIILEEELLKGDNYTYKVSNKGKAYIVTGHKLETGELKPEGFANIMTILKKVHKRYFISEIASTLSCNFIKPLGIDYVLDNCLYVEILFEYEGEPLTDVKEILIVYNLMRQSASALALLHALGFENVNLLLSNMRYDNSKDILKILKVENIEEGNKEAEVLSPPEIIRKKEEHNKDTDIYYWAMTFYSLILKKVSTTLYNEINLFKLGNEDKYEGFLDFMKEDIKKLNEDPKITELIIRILKRCLAFDPKKRPKIDEIVKEMKEFENEEKIVTKYSSIERKQGRKIVNALADIKLDDINNEELRRIEEELNEKLKQNTILEEQIKDLKEKYSHKTPIEEVKEKDKSSFDDKTMTNPPASNSLSKGLE